MHKNIRFDAVDWCVLCVFVFEFSSLLFSPYRPNSVGTSEAIAIAVLTYFAIRLVVRKSRETALLAGILSVSGTWLAYSCAQRTLAAAVRLADAGLTDLLAFRASFNHPMAGWVPGEGFTFFLLALPFACATTAYLLKKEKRGIAALSLLPGVLMAVSA
jgi:hypothetical protein